MKKGYMAPVALAVLFGVFHVFGREWFWNHLAVVDSMPRWLATHVTGGWWTTLLFGRDLLINVVLCLPIAVVLQYLRPHRAWLYLAIAMLAEVFWEYRSAFSAPLPQGLGYSIYMPGLVMTIAAFALAGAAIRMLARQRS